VGEFIAVLARDERIFLDLHVLAGVPFPNELAVRGHLVDEIAIHAAVGVKRSSDAAKYTFFDL